MALKVEGSSPFTHPFSFYKKVRFSPERAWCYEMMGYRQAVRHRTLTPAFAGSNPASPVWDRMSVNIISYGILAQVVEHLTFNQVVRGSSPRWLRTGKRLKTAYTEFRAFFFCLSYRKVRLIRQSLRGDAHCAHKENGCCRSRAPVRVCVLTHAFSDKFGIDCFRMIKKEEDTGWKKY